MKKICCIAEGYGDVDALPSLIAKTGAEAGRVIVSPNPIRGGEWPSIKRAGILERLLELAASRGWDQIMIVLDLDDGCPVNAYDEAVARVEAWRDGREVKVSVVFFPREYETLFLHEVGCLGDINAEHVPENPESIRGAKEIVKQLIGRRYKETTDQRGFTEKLNLSELEIRSRPFRKFKKEVLS